MKDDTVFKFVIVRPSQSTTTSAEKQQSQIRSGEATDHQNRLLQLQAEENSYLEAMELANSHILSDSYVLSPNSSNELLDKLESVSGIITAATHDSDIRTLLQAATGGTFESLVSKPAWAELKSGLWDGMYSGLVTRSHQQDLDELTAVMKAMHLIEHLAEGGDDIDIVQYYASLTPVISDSLFPKARSDQKVSSNQAESLVKPAEANPLLKQIVTIKNAISEVTEAFSRSHFDDEVGNQKQHIDSVKNAMSVEGSNAWVLPSAAQNTLSRSALEAIGDSNLSVETDSVLRITEKLESQVSLKTAQLARQKQQSRLGFLGQSLYSTSSGLSNEDLMLIESGAPELLPLVMQPISAMSYDRSNLSMPDLPAIPPMLVLNPEKNIKYLFGDLKIVKKTLVKYEAGEVAHIENILKSEDKQRSHRKLSKTEDFFSREEEHVKESVQDLESTERFELERETESTIEADSQLQAGASITARYGAIEATATTDYSSSTARADSSNSASSYAKDVVDRSVEKIKERVKELRSRKTIVEVEELNMHGFDNKAGSEHIVGIYRWVDKFYRAQVHNYGKRLMLEFLVPEPAALYLFAQSSSHQVAEFSRPAIPTFGPADIQPNTYKQYVQQYNAGTVKPPPSKFKTTGISIEGPELRDESVSVEGTIIDSEVNEKLSVPAGYKAMEAHFWETMITLPGSSGPFLRVHVGRRIFDTRTDINKKQMRDEDDTIPVTIMAFGLYSFVANVEVVCERTNEIYEQWQLDTFATIMQAYHIQLAAYEERIAASLVAGGVEISGNNPGQNRAIEKQELKRACITLLTHQHFETFDAMKHSDSDLPRIDVLEAAREAPFIQFFEQAFEWNQITYVLYPYFWSNRDQWMNRMSLKDTDPEFENFLRAGAARVVVPVDPAFKNQVLQYLQSGVIWGGSNTMIRDDKQFISIAEEIMTEDVSYPDGEPWEIRMPTALVILQKDSELPDFSTQPEDSDGNG